ncbi:MAG: hypothetical protein HFH09_01090 [Bacilli bacterium]|nr:hypothetical protein [Bacilli bacterium]
MEKVYRNKKEESEYWKLYNERKARKLLSFVKEIMGEGISYGEAKTPLERVSYLLEHLDDDALINTLSYYFGEYPINEKGFVLELLQLLAKYSYGLCTKPMINAYKKFSMIEKIAPKMSGFKIVTKSGTITVYRALEISGKRRVALKNYQIIQRNDVHLRMAFLNSSFSEDTVISCLMPRMFGGFSYEHYIKLIKENGYLDLRHNCFYPKCEFEEYFEPKILMRRKGKNLRTDIPPLFK